MRVGILELLAESVSQTWGERMYNLWYKKILASLTPQAVAAWCRQLGHQVYYATYYGQSDPKRLLPCIGSLSIRDSISRTMQRANGLSTPAFSRL